MIDVLIAGAGGKMGSLTVAAIAAQDDMRVVARVDPNLADRGEGAFTELRAALAATRPQVAVDFTTPSAVFDNVTQLLAARVHVVVGTTGLSDDQIDLLASIAASNHVNLVVAPNFALGAVLMMRFASEAARFLPRAEIVEIHEERKLDAPSGTSLRTARLMAEARGEAGGTAPDEQASRGLEAGGVRIHSVRLPGVIAHQEVLFGGQGELLTVRHDTLTREAFMPGVLLAVRHIGKREGTVVGLENLIL